MASVVGVGANSIDRVYHLPAYPSPSGALSKLRIERYERSPGGQTATVLAGCARLGLSAAYVGAVSDDDDGVFVRGALDACGVDTTHAVARPGPNPYALILLADADAASAGERIVLWDRSADMRLLPADIPRDLIASARALFVDDVDVDAAVTASAIARASGVPVVSDIEADGARAGELMAAVTAPIFAEHVPAALTGESAPERALRALRNRHGGWLCVTRGAHGAAMLAGGDYLEQRAFAVRPVDTTGAGDAFRAGFIFAMLRGDSPADVLRFACAAAAVSCTRAGAMNSVPTLSEVEALLRY